jgi:hypothetical protein
MPMTDTNIIYRVRIDEKQVKYGSLINGRTFQRPTWRDPCQVWIKINKLIAQPINDNNLRFSISEQEMVIQATLSQQSQAP